ncbi:MAG: protoporphyrinogen oxidase [Azospirillum sp.]|nr:protoporphyrinogen oxidase [Azospirillum sp.]
MAPNPKGEGVVVVGGGITGLSLAWFLSQRGIPVRVLDAQDGWGGVIRSSRRNGYLIEHGPNSTLQKPGREDDALGRLIAGAGLEPEVVAAGAAGSRRYVMRRGHLIALPASPLSFLTTPLFSWRAKARLMAEPFIARGRDEETIADFVRRRLGPEFLTYAIQPFVSGVFAGDAEQLSAPAAVPRIHALEQRYGSLIRGAVALGMAAKGAGMPAGRLLSFEQGMATLPRSLVARLPEGSCRSGCRVVGLDPEGSGWTLRWQADGGGAGVLRAATVVLAVPAPAAAILVEGLSEDAARLLRSIAYAPIVSAAIGFDRAAVRHPLDGFGYLVPRPERRRSLGGLFSSTLFPGRAPDGKVLITTFIGGTTDLGIAALDDDSLMFQVLADLAAAVGAAGMPELGQLTRYARAIPQYTLGHRERVARIDEQLRSHRSLYLQASWRDGVSVADCVRSAERLAERIALTAKASSGSEAPAGLQGAESLGWRRPTK